MKKSILIIAIAVLSVALVISIGATVRPQLSMDEQNLIVDSVIQTINPEGLAESIAATVEANVLKQIGGLADETAENTEETAISETESALVPTPTPAVESTYSGIHAKFVNSYAYTVGGDEGDQVTVQSEYTPNVLFNIDVVFENDGDTVWPALIEMRNVSTSGTYTGHSPNVIVDTTYAPVVPGGKRAFTIAAHGSEDLGYHTFYFQLYDAVSGSLIAGGSGSFSYLAK